MFIVWLNVVYTMNFGQLKVWFKDIINLLDKYILIGASSLIVFCVWQTQMVFQKLHQDQIHVM